MKNFFPPHFYQCLAIFCAGIFCFALGLNGQEVIGFEARYFLFAQEMWRQGVTWFPTTYGQPYPDYPVTSTLLIYWLAKCLGHLDKLTAILPSAIASALTLVFTFLIGKLKDLKLGLMAVAFLLLTNTFLMEARTISPDQYITLITTICFYLVYSADRLPATKRLYWLPILLLAGFAFRGPIGLVIPTSVVCVYYLVDRRFSHFFKAGFTALFILIVSCVILFSLAYHVGGTAFVYEVWQMEVAGRMQDAYLPVYFYFSESMGAYALTFPLAFLMLIFCGKTYLADKKFSYKLLAWIFIILIGLSIPAGKKIRYILAISPALALFCSQLFTLQVKDNFSRTLRASVLAILYILPMIAITGLFYVAYLAPQKHLNLSIAYTPWLIFFIFLQMLLFIRKEDTWVLWIGALSFVGVNIALIEPINLSLNRTRDFVHQVEVMRQVRGAKLVFYKVNADALPIKYMVYKEGNDEAIFLSSLKQLQDLKLPAIFLTDPETFAAMPVSIRQNFKQLGVGNVGHDNLLVFSR